MDQLTEKDGVANMVCVHVHVLVLGGIPVYIVIYGILLIPVSIPEAF